MWVELRWEQLGVFMPLNLCKCSSLCLDALPCLCFPLILCGGLNCVNLVKLELHFPESPSVFGFGLSQPKDEFVWVLEGRCEKAAITVWRLLWLYVVIDVAVPVGSSSLPCIQLFFPAFDPAAQHWPQAHLSTLSGRPADVGALGWHSCPESSPGASPWQSHLGGRTWLLRLNDWWPLVWSSSTSTSPAPPTIK